MVWGAPDDLVKKSRPGASNRLGRLRGRKPTKRGSAFSALPVREIRQLRFQRLGRDDLMADVRKTGVMINGRSEGLPAIWLVEVRLPQSFGLQMRRGQLLPAPSLA
jgi:hypothetical protein